MQSTSSSACKFFLNATETMEISQELDTTILSPELEPR